MQYVVVVVVDADYGGREGQALGLGLLSFYACKFT